MGVVFTKDEKEFIHCAVRRDMKRFLSVRLYGDERKTGKDWPEDWKYEFTNKLEDNPQL